MSQDLQIDSQTIQPTQKSLGLTTVLHFLRRYCLFIFFTTCMGIILSWASVKTWVTPIYQAQTSLLILPNQSGNQFGSMLSQLESKLEMLGPLRTVISGQQFSSSLKDLLSILRSRSLSEQILAQYPRLKELPEAQKEIRKHKKARPQQVLLQWLSKSVEIYPPDSKDGTLRIQVKLSDASLASEVANSYVQKLEVFVRKLITQDASENQNYLDKQLKDMSLSLKIAEEELLAYQRKHHLISLDDEAKQLITQLSELEAQEVSARAALKETKAKLSQLENQSTELNPNWSEMANQLELNSTGLNQRQNELKKARLKYERLLAALPNQALGLARLERKITLKNQLYVLLNQQVQAARLESARKPALFKVLDTAIPMDEPVFPVIPVVLAISGIISIGLGSSLSLLHFAMHHTKELVNAET
jgi:uncharacterized protein involved in exopolysaccharide biosynthesis